MSARIIPFPKKFHPVWVAPTEDGWLVIWRSCGWLHATKNMALADAAEIAAAHGTRVMLLQRAEETAP
jgi:hypothetical protein